MTEEYRTETVYSYNSDAPVIRKGRLGKCFIYDDRHGFRWYCCRKGSIVNKTYSEITHGINIEDQDAVKDIDCFTWDKPILTMREFKKAMNA